MDEEYYIRPEYEFTPGQAPLPEEYGQKTEPPKPEKKKKLAQLMLYSWIMLMIGGAAVGADEPCTVTAYDADGAVIAEQTVTKDEPLVLPEGDYELVFASGGETVSSPLEDTELTAEELSEVPAAEDGMRRAEVHKK